jgi:hypothetical protein
MAHEHDVVGALRTAVALGRIDDDAWVAPDVQQLLARGLPLLVDLLELPVVEPDAPAAAVAHVDGEAADGDGGQRMAAGGTRHGHASSIGSPTCDP